MIFYRKAHDNYPSDYFTSAKKCYLAMVEELETLEDYEKEEFTGDDSITLKQSKDGKTIAGWWMTKEVAR